MKNALALPLSLALCTGCASSGFGGGGSEDEGIALRGPKWELTTIQGQDVLDDVTVTMTLSAVENIVGATPQMEGNGGCNRYLCSFEHEGTSLKINRPAATFDTCNRPKGVMEQERRYFELLEQVATYDLLDNRLAFFSAEGAPLLTFVTD